jgi:ABC-type multidrug transport system fused ATPase/permease subunit
MGGALLQAGAAAVTLSESYASADRISELLGVGEIRDACPRLPVSLTERVTFDRVSFSYTPGGPVLESLSFDIPPDNITALVGVSGAGKSTIAKLALGLYQPTLGRVLIDGHDFADLDVPSFRRMSGYVPQSVMLLSGSIRDNILFGRTTASAQQFESACRCALVDEFAERLPSGYDTPIGERGVQLSGGQAQRIAIARALLLDPQILVLDEPTATLDAESAEAVYQAIHSSVLGRTTLIIAHSLSIIRNARQILVVAGGRLVECGTHEELVSVNGTYRQMFAGELDAEFGRNVMRRRRFNATVSVLK